MKSRLYIDKKLILEADYAKTLEDYFLAHGELGINIHIEVPSATGTWPSDLYVSKENKGCKTSTSGLYNLGNSKLYLKHSLLYERMFTVLGKHNLYKGLYA